MSSANQSTIRNSFVKLGEVLRNPNEQLEAAIWAAQHSNAWFTPEMTAKSVASYGDMLTEEAINDWFSNIPENSSPKKVGLILAGNIPMVGFHDVLSVVATGNTALIKLSSSDDKLIPLIAKTLTEINPELAQNIQFVERLVDFDAVIATGSNNSSRYFDYYFGKVPHIIRKNRSSAAVLTGKEKAEDIAKLGNDIFDYFGLGCRNVAKIYIPEGYDIHSFFAPLEPFQPVIHHFKYNNNYDYNKSIYLVNSVKHYDNGFLLLREEQGFVSPLATLYYETYTHIEDLETQLAANKEQLQCVVAYKGTLNTIETVNFGDSQKPKLTDYADNIDTVAFLKSL